jgi:hypothetical protein
MRNTNLLALRAEPKRWYYISKCGCTRTSVRHPWVTSGLTWHGEIVWHCREHEPADPERAAAAIAEVERMLRL